ncbi:hypothetical protein HDF24_01295 [Mucilaginibacter sp. X4EP1]|uniref:hypothetical protein n=1 Tax=Mucilaginibacter sp. X4EP1 TaxID=2723092 RepID=UPI002169ABCC|nr:hypothetical protein [Mucilaginibacter sp. X4EP1]MCS3811651.1 putative membrane protein YgcG [Mucilaginibacter sp. X4EP1]
MKLSGPSFFIAVSLQLAAISFCTAQSNKNAIATLQAPPAKIVIDGDIKEWGDSLRYYNTEKRINYAIANTKDTLYIAIRVNDRSEQIRILRAGITFTIDPKGKKKETYSITFPLNVNGSVSLPPIKKDDVPADVTQEDRDELMRERLTNLRGIKVVGFKDIETDMITTSNTYGFQTAVKYDDNNYLICEAAIPMSFFHADGSDKNEWAFNFRINGIQKKPNPGNGDAGSESQGGGHGGGMGGGGRGGHGGGRGNHNSEALGADSPSELNKTEDFWEKFYLAK